jgi:translation initiation factor IF-2
MTKNLKLNIKNPQIAGAINLSGLKAKLSKKKPEDEEAEELAKAPKAKKKESEEAAPTSTEKKTKPRAKAKTEGEEQVLDLPPAKASKPKAELEHPEAKAHEAKVSEAKAKEQTHAPQAQPPKATPAPVSHVAQAPAPQAPVQAQITAPAQVPTPAPAPKPQAPKLGPVFPEKKSIPEERPPATEQERRPQQPSFDQRSGHRPPSQPYSGERRPYTPSSQQPPRSDYRGHPGSQQRPPSQGYRPDSRPPREGSGPWQRPPAGQAPSGPPHRRPPYPGQSSTGPSGGQGSQDRPPYQQRAPYQPRPPYQGQGQGYQGNRPPMSRGPMPSPRPVLPGQDKGGAITKRDNDFKPRIAPDAARAKGAPDFSKAKAKETAVKRPEVKAFDARMRHGFVQAGDEEGGSWRKRRPKHGAGRGYQEKEIIRPTKVKVRLPISIKDLASEMKLKASELVSKLFIQGIIVTLNDSLDDPIVVGILGHEFGCEVVIDTSVEQRIRISDKNVKEEIAAQEPGELIPRPPVVAFMGHVDHGKTSLIDAIRKSNRAAKEVGAITQHIGAFKCVTAQGPLTILDTPGHEAFTLMRERGAHVTDIVVLVIAGDEGIQEQTVEAIKQARTAKATIVVALTKSDKPNFNSDNIFRQLADQELLPEAWGGQTIIVNTSAVSGQGIQELLEMLALQAEVLELKANPKSRARGTVIESEIKQGMGATANVLVQNGTLRVGDALVFGAKWAKVKGMRDENGHELKEAAPSTPVQVSGLSGLPEAGEEFIVVKSEKEAREVAEMRQEGRRETSFQVKKRRSVESFIENAVNLPKKVLTVILRTDVQGSLEALTKALERIKSDKVEINIISQGVGQISESDAELATASTAVILGFHTSIEAHTEQLIKEMGIKVYLHDIIYHAVDKMKELMKALLDKLPVEIEKGKAEVKAVFKASQLGLIAGCIVTEGVITRSSQIRLKREKAQVWKGNISSLKRVKEDVKEVQKGIECGILLQNNNDVLVGDIMEAFEVTYVEQEL